MGAADLVFFSGRSRRIFGRHIAHARGHPLSPSLKERTGIQALARFLVDWPPGSGNPGGVGHVSFETVAEKVGVGSYWQPGTREPMLIARLRGTLEHPPRVSRVSSTWIPSGTEV